MAGGADGGARLYAGLAGAGRTAPAAVALGDLEQAVRRLEEDPRRAVEAAVLKARGYMVRQDLAAARGELEAVRGRFPRSWWPRLLLGDLLIQEGKDWTAAEAVLRKLLAIDPEHAPTKRKLETVMERQARP